MRTTKTLPRRRRRWELLAIYRASSAGSTRARWISIWQVVITVFTLSVATHVTGDEGKNVGAKKCRECHASAYTVWEGTAHFQGFATLHRSKRAKSILKTVKGKSSAKKNWSCTLCHYTMVSKRGRRARASSGVSCESCHGPGDEWIDVHWDPGEYKSNANEPPEHKAERLEMSRERGMVHAQMEYELARSCTFCHGLARDDLKAIKLARMFEAGHPIVDEFEHLAYAMGTLRHGLDEEPLERLTPARRAYLLVVGAAAKWVSAKRAAGRIDHPRYVGAQQARAASAQRVLDALGDLSQARALLAEPTDSNAKKLVSAIGSIDLLSKVRHLLPPDSAYK